MVFYYLGDRTVIKTPCQTAGANMKFYYLGDPTVIKTVKKHNDNIVYFTTWEIVR